MQRALERSNPHRRHIAELTNGINIDYINRIKNKEPIHFGGLKKELIAKLEGGMMVKNSSYQGDVIKAFSIKNNMPKPDMHFIPDTLATGKPIRFNPSGMPNAVFSEYQAVKDVGNMELNEDINQLRDNDYELIKNMNMKDLNKYLKKKQGEKIKESAKTHKGIQNKRLQRRIKAIDANEMKESDIDLSGLFGAGRPIGLPKPRTVGGKRTKKC
jgi:hypothetical protein